MSSATATVCLSFGERPEFESLKKIVGIRREPNETHVGARLRTNKTKPIIPNTNRFCASTVIFSAFYHRRTRDADGRGESHTRSHRVRLIVCSSDEENNNDFYLQTDIIDVKNEERSQSLYCYLLCTVIACPSDHRTVGHRARGDFTAVA